MSRHLVVCCDGTWNRPDQLSDGARAPSNVSKIALGVAPETADGTPQLLYYQRGVGTAQFQRIRGGAFGYGLSRNVRDCYRFLVEHYEPGDKLYFFGFSRGAYTARSTAGFVRNCGILRPDQRDRVDEAYSLYRSRANRTHPSSIESRIFRQMYSRDDIPIHFIGVWDTVGSLGIPIDGMRIPFIDKYWGFHDTELSSQVRSAYQALAIDEQRGPFKPTMWTQQPGADAGGQRLEQVWFAGVHCDVGGGYRDPGLSEIALLWMAQRAVACGLELKPGHLRIEDGAGEERWLGMSLEPHAMAEIHDSRTIFYKLFPRNLRALADRDRQSAASSAIRRLREHEDYRPPSLEQWAAADRRVTAVPDGSQRPPTPPACGARP